MKELTEKDALYKAAAYCSNAEHCRSEVESKLEAWGTPSQYRDKILDQLTADNYISEERYCQCFINDKFKFNKWGRLKITQALRLKGIRSEIYEKELKNIHESEYLSILSKLIADKKKTLKANNEYELRGKLIRFGLSRGFEMDAIQRCIKPSGHAQMD